MTEKNVYDLGDKKSREPVKPITPNAILDALAARDMPFDVEQVMTLKVEQEQPYRCCYIIFAHIAHPLGFPATPECPSYALLAMSPQSGVVRLGEIDPKTRNFEAFGYFSTYERDKNRVICQMNVPAEYLDKLKTIYDICKIPEVTVISKTEPFREVWPFLDGY